MRRTASILMLALIAVLFALAVLFMPRPTHSQPAHATSPNEVARFTAQLKQAVDRLHAAINRADALDGRPERERIQALLAEATPALHSGQQAIRNLGPLVNQPDHPAASLARQFWLDVEAITNFAGQRSGPFRAPWPPQRLRVSTLHHT